jgi:hypothetical protein
MSLLRFRRLDDPSRRLAELERAHHQLVCEHDELRFQLEQEIERVCLLASSPWLDEAVSMARAAGWQVSCSLGVIVFHHPRGGEHSYPVRLPLPEDGEQEHAIRRDLQMRLMLSGAQMA